MDLNFGDSFIQNFLGMLALMFIFTLTLAGEHIIIGNFTRKLLNTPNYIVDKVLDGKEDLPDNWVF